MCGSRAIIEMQDLDGLYVEDTGGVLDFQLLIS